MPRKSNKPHGTIVTAVAAFALLFGIWAGIRLGAFNWVGRLLVNHATTSMDQEAERQKAENTKP